MIPSEEGPDDGEGDGAGRILLGVVPGAAEDGGIILCGSDCGSPGVTTGPECCIGPGGMIPACGPG